MGTDMQLTGEWLPHSGALPPALPAVLLPGGTWAPGGSSPAPRTLPSVVEPRDPQQGADPGAAGAGAVPDHPADGPAELGAGAASGERGGGGGALGVSGEAAVWADAAGRTGLVSASCGLLLPEISR